MSTLTTLGLALVSVLAAPKIANKLPTSDTVPVLEKAAVVVLFPPNKDDPFHFEFAASSNCPERRSTAMASTSRASAELVSLAPCRALFLAV